MKPNDVVKISLWPCCARSRITRSASAPSGTFSTKVDVTLSPSAASISPRPRWCCEVQPASPTGLTYTNPTFSGSAAAGAAAAFGASAFGAGGASCLPQAAASTAISDMATSLAEACIGFPVIDGLLKREILRERDPASRWPRPFGLTLRTTLPAHLNSTRETHPWRRPR